MAIATSEIDRLAERYKKGLLLTDQEIDRLRRSLSISEWEAMEMERPGDVTYVTKEELEARSALVKIAPGKSDAEIAAEFRDEAIARLAPVIDLINEARQKGMTISFQIGPPDSFNRQSLVLLEITKKLC